MLKPKITLKQEECPAQIAAIAEETIKDSYPKYYPSGAVAFFLNLHNELNIASVKNQERIYLVCQKETVIGTISVRANEICRFFILPEYQKKGYGSCAMDLIEEELFQTYQSIQVAASFPAESMYLKRGYQIVSYETIETENGDVLCYHTMEKKRLLDR